MIEIPPQKCYIYLSAKTFLPPFALTVPVFVLLIYMPVSLRQAAREFRPSTGSIALPKAPVNPGRALLRISRHEDGQYLWIRKGKQGSLQTAWQMAQLVRQDTVRDEGLQDFAAQLLRKAGLDSHSDKRAVIRVVFDYVQQLHYVHDPAGSFESIQSARRTIARGYGDCDDLSVVLATLLAVVGFQPRFVLARYNPASKGYDHIYVDVDLPQGRVALDPSSRRNGMGWESPKAIERLTFPIFAHGDGMGNPQVTNAALQGAQIGLNFVPVVGPILSALVSPIAGLFSRGAQRGEEAARDEWVTQVYNGLGQIADAVDSCQVSRADGQKAAQLIIQQYYDACAKFTKKSVTASCHNYGTQADAFPARLTRIDNAGGRCALAANAAGPQIINADGSISPGSPNSAVLSGVGGVSLGGSTISLPILAALGIGGLILWKVMK